MIPYHRFQKPAFTRLEIPIVFSFKQPKVVLIFLAGVLAVSPTLDAGDIEAAPINYSQAKATNLITQLEDKILSGKITLNFEPGFGYLNSLTKALEVPLSSQMLVFSKTSLQRNRIAPQSPRAVYFNDEIYVGFCQGGEVMEISVPDPQLGTAFYTLEQVRQKKPRFQRHNDTCLICHGSSATQGYPGHLARSVYPDREGQPLFHLGSHRVEPSTPLNKRWGGWYVSGKTPGRHHLGNLILPQGTRNPPEENPKGTDMTDLSPMFPTNMYPTPHSDLVALLVFEHQAEIHNRIARAVLETRVALFQQEEFDRILERKTPGLSEGTQRRIHLASESLVEGLFFCGEASLGGVVSGTSNFATDFAKKGPTDAKGRSLREFDLKDKIFLHPLSYMVLSTAFEQMPPVVKEMAIKRITTILNQGDSDEKYSHLTVEKRKEIREILAGTDTVWAKRLNP